MNEQQKKAISKFLSYILRHHPQSIGLRLDAEGWATVTELLQKAQPTFKDIDRPALDLVVATNDKKRFAYNHDGTKIRASQGHSIEVALQLTPQVPPPVLYHGTVARFIDTIREEGLRKMNRQHVHLSAEKATAVNVAGRRGAPVVLTVRAQELHESGVAFYLSDNGVWLTDAVPAGYIEFE